MPSSIIPYSGGKSTMAGYYLDLVPSHETWVEVFCGAAWVTLAKNPRTSRIEIINDLYRQLVNFWLVIKHMPEEFMHQADLEIRSRAIFEMYAEALDRPVDPMPNPIAAWRFWYVIKSTFTASMSYPRLKYNKVGSPVSRHTHLADIDAKFPEIMAVHERLRHVDIECLDFRDCVKRYDSSVAFFFLDPPYWQPKSGPQDYVHRFREEDHLDLARILKGINGKFMLTYEDSARVRQHYSWANVAPVEFNYSVPHAGSAGESKAGAELIITNYDTGSVLGPLFSLQAAD